MRVWGILTELSWVNHLASLTQNAGILKISRKREREGGKKEGRRERNDNNEKNIYRFHIRKHVLGPVTHVRVLSLACTQDQAFWCAWKAGAIPQGDVPLFPMGETRTRLWAPGCCGYRIVSQQMAGLFISPLPSCCSTYQIIKVKFLKSNILMFIEESISK